MAIPPVATSQPTPVVAIYADEPTLTESFDRGIMSGSRTERITFVAKAGGRFDAPPVNLKWFNLETGTVEIASADGFELNVAGPPPATVESWNWRGVITAWLPIVAALLVFCLLILRYWPRVMGWYQAHREAYRASERFAYLRAQRALRRHQLGASLKTTRTWWRFWEPTGRDLPRRTTQHLTAVGAELYGRNAATGASGPAWTGAANSLADARKEMRRAERHREEAALPALNPTAANRGV